MGSIACREKWHGTMTDRERFVNQMHYRPVDRCFNMEFGYWEENFSEWDIFVDNGITTNEEADLFFNFDPCPTVWINSWLRPGFGLSVVEETETKKIIRNEDGLLAEVTKDGHSSIPHFIQSSVTTPDDWQRVKEERMRLDDPARRRDIEALKQRYPEDRDYPLGVFCGSMIGKVRDLLTMEGLAYACFDYPAMVEDMVETTCQLVEQGLEQLLPHFDFDYASGWEDICCNSGPLVSVEFFRDVVMPRYKRISAKLRAAGIDIWYTDCDGDIRALLPYFLEGGINCLFPWEVNGCGHPAEARKTYGKELLIMGGVDKMQLAAGKKEIRAYLASLQPLVEEGGYIPFCDHRCPPNVTPENYLYYLDLKEQMFGCRD